MAAPKLKVTYVDGREEIVRVTPRAQLMTEERFGGANRNNTARTTVYASWAALHKAGREPKGFEEFVDLIDDVENVIDPAAPCSVCGQVGGCAYDQFDEDNPDNELHPLFHEPPTVSEAEIAGPTKPAPGTTESPS